MTRFQIDLICSLPRQSRNIAFIQLFGSNIAVSVWYSRGTRVQHLAEMPNVMPGTWGDRLVASRLLTVLTLIASIPRMWKTLITCRTCAGKVHLHNITSCTSWDNLLAFNVSTATVWTESSLSARRTLSSSLSSSSRRRRVKFWLLCCRSISRV